MNKIMFEKLDAVYDELIEMRWGRGDSLTQSDKDNIEQAILVICQPLFDYNLKQKREQGL